MPADLLRVRRKDGLGFLLMRVMDYREFDYLYSVDSRDLLERVTGRMFSFRNEHLLDDKKLRAFVLVSRVSQTVSQ